MVAGTLPDQALEALRLAEADPGRSIPLAKAVARQARAARDMAAASVAERALGLAALHLQDPGTALRHLRAAVTFGHRAGSARLAAAARLRLAFVLNVRGRPRAALREIDALLQELHDRQDRGDVGDAGDGNDVGDVGGVERARAQAQRGVILHDLGRLDEALASYQSALPVLRRADDHEWLKKVLSNRGILHGQRHEFAAAEADLCEAEQLNRALGLDLTLAFVQQNLGWVCSLRGDVPRALDYFDLAEGRLRDLRSRLGLLFADRGQLLLSVGLISEARQAAAQAVRSLEQERRHIALPEARLLLARAATLEGDHAQALDQARRAVREFARQQRPDWAALARFTVMAAQFAGQPHSRIDLGAVRGAADQLGPAGWPAEALDARLLGARLAIERGRTALGRELLEQSARVRHRGPATLRARAWYAEALLRRLRGERGGAVTAARAALRILDDHRAATLGATDLRAHASGQRVELAEFGLRIAVEDGLPSRIFAWAEQGRAGHLLLRPVRPPDDPTLAADLAELRATVAEIDEARDSGRGTAGLLQRQVTLERQIRDYCRRQPGEPILRPPGQVPLRAVATALGPAALLEFVQLDDRMHVVTVICGRTRFRRLGTMARVRDLVNRVAFALRRLARPRVSEASRTAAVVALRHAAGGLDDMLLRPLAAELADRPLVVVPTGPLQALPWSILPSCAGRPVTVSPSAALWHAADRGGQPPTSSGGVVVAAGPGLAGARAEADAVAAIHRTVPLVDRSATVDAVAATLNGAELAHLAAHGRVDLDNPLFSALRLADGPLTVYDLERLARAPRMVVLAACDIGRPVVRAGDELLGLSATFLSLGAQHIIASTTPVPDAETAPLMVAFHRLLARGNSAATALAAAQQRLAGEDTAAMAAAAGFICMGADVTLREPSPAGIEPPPA